MGLVERFMTMFTSDLGIDLGTANTLVAVQGKGVVISEPSVVAVRKGTKEVLMNGNAVGDMAKIMLGKNPGNIQVVRPMKDGVIADFEITEAMLRYFIRKAHGRRGQGLPHPRADGGGDRRRIAGRRAGRLDDRRHRRRHHRGRGDLARRHRHRPVGARRG